MPQKFEEEEINELIQYPEIRLLDADKEQLGIMDTATALEMAQGDGLDLVCISPQASPPVCQIMDYGKFKFKRDQGRKEAKKKARESKVDTKVLKFRPNVAEHDYQTRVRQATRFLGAGDKVQAICQFRGREFDFTENGFKIFTRFQADLDGQMKVETKPRMMGRQLVMILAPVVVKGAQTGKVVKAAEEAAKELEAEPEEQKQEAEADEKETAAA